MDSANPDTRFGRVFARLFGRHTPIALLLAALACAPAHARLECGFTGGTRVLAVGSISVPANAAVGSTVATLAPGGFRMTCRLSANPPVVTSATLTATFGTSEALQPVAGFNDVYPTSIGGLGVRYAIDIPGCSATNAVVRNSALTVTCRFNGAVGAELPVSGTVTATIVVTGPIATGATAFVSAPRLPLAYRASSSPGAVFVQQPLYSGAASGTLTRLTCSVATPNVAVTLPAVRAGAFSAGVGTVAGSQTFSLGLTCQAGTQIWITMTDVVDPANRGNALRLTAGSSARGVGIQIVDVQGMPVSFGPDSSVAGNPGQWRLGSSLALQPLNYNLSVRYVRTGFVVAGSVAARATFTLSYQ